MKKNLAIILGLILGILCICMLSFSLAKDKTLKGEKVSDALYLYDLGAEAFYYPTFKNNFLYYVEEDYQEQDEDYIIDYDLKKLDIYTNQTKSIMKLDNTKKSCYLKNNYLYCDLYEENYFEIYDLTGKQVYKDTNTLDFEDILDFIPYKDTFIKVVDYKFYIQDIQTVDISNTIKENLYICEYYQTSDNTYVLLQDTEGDTEESLSYYVYDINNKTYKTFPYLYYESFENGFFFLSEKEITVYDIKNDKVYTYENKLGEYSFYDKTLSSDNKTLYFYSEDYGLIFYNLLDNTIMEIKDEVLSDNTIIYLKEQSSYLLITTYDLTDYKYYILDLSKIKNNYITVEDYLKQKSSEVTNTISRLEETYNIKIHIKEDTIKEYPDFSAEVINSNNTILKALKDIASVAAKYNKEFFTSFYEDGMTGINLYLTGTLTPSDLTIQISNPAAYTLYYESEYMIVIDITQDNIEELLCHELLHTLENKADFSMFEDWDSLNPSNFSYDYSYTDDQGSKYVMYIEEQNANVYFIDTYSYTFPTEDRATIFGNICSCNTLSEINNYPNLYLKANYLKAEILEYYPMLENTSLFNSLN